MMEKYGKVVSNVLQKNYTTYKLSGKIKKVIYPTDVLNLVELLKYLSSNNMKYMVIGNGSNIIFMHDYDGVIIKLDNFRDVLINETEIMVGAGYDLIKLAMKTARLGLSGLEFASGIPGTIGGAVYMNAGAYNHEMSEIVKDITIIDDNFEVKKLSKKDIDFGYRNSILKRKKYICISATLSLKKGDREKILEVIKERKEKRKKTQPLNYPSAGSVFQNPSGDFAGRLIEQAGLKGMNINDAVVSKKHANFIINKGCASGKDIKKLMFLVKKEVLKKYGIELISEQEFIE